MPKEGLLRGFDISVPYVPLDIIPVETCELLAKNQLIRTQLGVSKSPQVRNVAND